MLFDDGSRFVFRLSGTGSSGATVHLYAESYTPPSSDIFEDTQTALSPLVQVCLTSFHSNYLCIKLKLENLF